jgi:lysophospholipid acyltransferase (LPLAT)-like uncharacterized protein
MRASNDAFLHLATGDDSAKQRPVTSSATKLDAHVVRGWRRAVLWPLALLVRAWARTLRFEISTEDTQLLARADRPLVFMLWHNRLFVAAEIYRRFLHGRTVYGLVSKSRDGAWLAAFFSLMGLRVVRGSSSRGGREAVTALVDVLRAGHAVGITPDGPRGPCYDFKTGGLMVARRAGARVVLMGMEFSSARRLRSWDGFYVPKPFSRVHVRCVVVPDDALNGPESSASVLRAQLIALSPDLTAVKSRA